MTRDERLMSYVDGELTAEERAGFEAELAADPALRREAERQQALRRRLSAAFDPVLQEPVPLQLTLAAQAANASGRRWGPQQWGAVAAAAIVGVLVGRTILPEGGPLAARQGALVIRGELASALDRKLAAETGAIQVGLSFSTQDGRYCRTFQSTPDRLAGLACRQAEGWTAQALTAWTPGAAQGYRTAGSETPAPVLAAVDGLIAGPPLDAAEEVVARDRGWRR